jgi:DNA-binding winged helix-turn-helix (wHTH) protein/Tol biopolymer transport system component
MDIHAGRRRFGRFELDLRTRTLFKDGRRVRLEPQPARVLAMLVERAGDVVSREELRRGVWDTATFVEFDQGLNYCIRQIRLALGDNASAPVFVETAKKVGYRFIAPVEGPAAAPTVSAAPAPIPVAPMPAVARAQAVRPSVWSYAALTALGLAAAGFALRGAPAARPSTVAYTQLTSFNTPAFAPALSPDGRMVAFIVGSDAAFPTTGEVYTKELPDGDPVQRTHDAWPKYGVAFSPDGSQITYTEADASHGWITSALPAHGGEGRVLLSNAAGLTWLDDRHALFSEIKSGLHMGLVTATTARSELRDIYLPRHERGMAHYAFASPDRSSVIVVEMGPTGGWERCRLVPFDGRTDGAPVGPDGPCTSAGWSPDGAWMYFTARAAGGSHLWRQRLPSGALEQLTFGPGEEDGVALSPDGRSVITSLGMTESGVWLHAGGEQLVSPDGYASGLSFSRDGRQLYYLLRRAATAGHAELWATDLASRTSAPVIRGFDLRSYDVSADGRRIVFGVHPAGGPAQIWLAGRDGAPRMLASSGEDTPMFGPDGDVLFRGSDGATNALVDMPLDGGRRSTPVHAPIIELKGLSPDRRWAIAMVPVHEIPSTAVVAISLRDGTVRRICPAQCLAQWSPDGSRFYVEPLLQGPSSGLAVAVPVPAGESMPVLPASGIRSAADAALIPGSRVIDLSPFDPGHQGLTVVPGPEPDTFAYTRSLSHRNLFQIRLPDT